MKDCTGFLVSIKGTQQVNAVVSLQLRDTHSEMLNAETMSQSSL